MSRKIITIRAKIKKSFLCIISDPFLKKDGRIIIDLNNPQFSGKKTDKFDNIARTMEWDFNPQTKVEKSNIIFEIDNKKYKDYHIFRIFSIDEVKKCCFNVGLKVENVYENYDINIKGTKTSKNLQFIIVNQ